LKPGVLLARFCAAGLYRNLPDAFG
jgi:hypothetical protein